MSFQKLFSWSEKRPKNRSGSKTEEEDLPEKQPLPLRCWNMFSSPVWETINSAPLGSRTLHQQIAILRSRMAEEGYPDPGETPVRFALQSKSARGDIEKAYELLLLIQLSIDGVIGNYHSGRKLLGAENRGYSTCYLDSLLFAMFARLGFFDAILYTSYDDEPRQKLIVLVRLWVNMLRSGKLITADITRLLQNTLAECGWTDSARLRQQDASEAFTFIAEKLDLPHLTLKMDIFHHGTEEVSNDHRFVNERLLEVAIPPPRSDDQPILLEDCLELYFNNLIQVKRHLTRQSSLYPSQSSDSLAKGGSSHVETVDPHGISLSDSPKPGGVLPDSLSRPKEPLSLSSESMTSTPSSPVRTRTSSIVRRRFVPDLEENNQGSAKADLAEYGTRGRSGSIRKEVMMPAWQMFSLIPWYTHNIPEFQTAVHFSSRRPILGICLKRYTLLPDKSPVRLDTKIDIPLEIAMPHFIKDDSLTEDAPLYGQFKLCLQSVVCHQGYSVESGHYIALVRGTKGSTNMASQEGLSNDDPGKESNHWLRFDDLAKERITLVDIEKALADESPYILFYQITPLDEDKDQSAPPPYTEPEYPLGGLDVKKTGIDVDDYALDSDSRLNVGGSEQDLPDGSRVTTRSIPSNKEERSSIPRRFNGSFRKGFSKGARASPGSEGRITNALTYISRRKSLEPLDDKRSKWTSPHRASGDIRRDKSRDKSLRRQSDQFDGSDRTRNKGVLKRGSINPPERECLVM